MPEIKVGHFRLPVGYFTKDGGSIQYEELDGQALAEAHEMSPTPTPDAVTNHVRAIHRELYRSSSDEAFVVHSILEVGGIPPSFLGRLERYRTWGEVMQNHPDLAKSSNYAIPSP